VRGADEIADLDLGRPQLTLRPRKDESADESTDTNTDMTTSLEVVLHRILVPLILAIDTIH
jgi:hypothetical protein